MRKGLLIASLLLLSASLAEAAQAVGKEVVCAAGLKIFSAIAIGCGFGIGIAAFGTGLGMGHAINAALQGTARNPEAGGRIMTTMIIGLALIESLCIYALVVAMILLFVHPAIAPAVKALGGH